MNNQTNRIEILLEHFSPILGQDFIKYKNHVSRVFLNCLLIDNNSANQEKYATAAVFHDIGIWTNHTIDYLDPSIEQARVYLTKTGKEDWIEEITLMIYWHHKPGRYKGNFEATVETFRRADWIDVSLGLKSFGLDRKKLKEFRNEFPNKGFHSFLLRKLTRNFFSHPLNPLPMFKT
jgi:hypothetical protein